MKSLVNRVNLLGLLGKDPEVTTFESGSKRATFSLATTEFYKNKDGERVENTDWHQIVVWGKQVDFVESYLKKGKKIVLEGKLTTRKYDDKDGVTHFITEVIANDILILTPKEKAA